MKTSCLLLHAIFIVAGVNIAIIDCALTEKQMLVVASMIREACQPKFGLTDEIIDGLKIGKFPENPDLMCYVSCSMDMMTITRNGIPNIQAALRQIKMIPEELRENYVNALNACKDSAEGIVEDKCRIAYKMLECFYHNNPTFIFP